MARRAARQLQNIERIQGLRDQLRDYIRENENNQTSDTSSSDIDSENPSSGVSDSDQLSDHDNINDLNVDSDNGQNVDVMSVDGDNSSDGEQERVDAAQSDSSGSDHGSVDSNEQRADDLTADEKEAYVIESVREWALSPGVLSYKKLDDLLHRLHFVYENMPVSYKTLLGVPSELEIQDNQDHQFWYHGIKNCLNSMNLAEYLEKFGRLEIDINMDGLPISKNPAKKFWPILGRLVESVNKPFIIGIYFVSSDPVDLDLYLGDLCLELRELGNEGFNYDGHVYPFSTRHFILDAVARSFVKCCIGHAGYGACEKCTVVGAYSHGRVNFANVGLECEPRSDDSYRNQTDHLHHTGRSPLELAGVGMVSQFRLDTMHLVHKGVFRRYLEALNMWNGPWRLNEAAVQRITVTLLGLEATRPRDFNRPQRSFKFWNKFKCTELRRLMLYDGLLAFKDKVHPNIYQQYLLLQCSMYILSSPYLLPLYVDDAENFLEIYVDYCKQVFGNHFVSYNVHSLLHLGQECRAHGPADTFSAYVFENELKSIKDTLKSGYKPVHQIAIRESRKRDQTVILKSDENSVELFHPHVDQCEVEPGRQFQEIVVNGTTFKLGNRDSCFVTTGQKIVLLRNIVCQGERIIFRGLAFLQNDDVYVYPMRSSLLGIVKVRNLNENVESFPLESVFGKCWLMEDEEYFVAVPLGHTTPLLH